ncbi:hypothetical protein BH20ACI4_BH20ACI4_06380 [soil metagenome]
MKNGETVSLRPRGHSMKGKIESGQLCTVEPIKDCSSLEKGDIVLCKVNGAEYLHLIKAIQGKRFQIGNNRGRINGWVGTNAIFVKCIKIED